MAKVIKILWRLDFSASYAYLDRRGSALQVLTDTVEEFWTNVGPGRIPLSYAADKLEDGLSHTAFSWEITSLNGSTEWPIGVELSRAFETPVLRSVDRIIKEALKLSDIKVVSRAGIRLFCVENFASKSDEPIVKRFDRLIDNSFATGLAKTIGTPNDVAFIYEGADADGLSYRAQFGPYAAKNPKTTFLADWKELPSALDKSDLFFDIDIYQQNFSFSEHAFYRWASTKVQKAASFIEFCAKNIK